MDGKFSLEITPKVIEGKQYEPGYITKSYTLSYQAVGTPWEKRKQYYFANNKELQALVLLLQAGLDTK